MMMMYNIRDVDNHGKNNLHCLYNINCVVLYFKTHVFNILAFIINDLNQNNYVFFIFIIF